MERWHDDAEEARPIHEVFGIAREAYLEWLKNPHRLAELLAAGAGPISR